MAHQSKLVGGLYLHRGKDFGEPNTKRIIRVSGKKAGPSFTLIIMFCKVGIGVKSKFGTK